MIFPLPFGAVLENAFYYNFIYIQLQGGKSVTERGKKASVRSAGTGGHGCRNDNSIKVNNPRKVKWYIYNYIYI